MQFFVDTDQNSVTNNAQVREIYEGCRTLYVQVVQEGGRVVMTMERGSWIGSKWRCVGGSRTVLLLGRCAGL